jgi:hypothetical protein
MKNIIIAVLTFVLTVYITVGCSNNSSSYSITPWATDYPPTAVALTMESVPPLLLTSTPFETPTLVPGKVAEHTSLPESKTDQFIDNFTPTLDQKAVSVTPTPNSSEAKIQIISPGTLSKVISPIILTSYAQPGSDNKVYIELIGEDGQILFQDFRIYKELPRLWAPVNLSLPFSSNAVTEFARLQIFTRDQFQRIVALNSVNIFLQSDGLNRIYLNNVLYEYCVVINPTQMASIYGGSVRIEGKFHPTTQQPIIFELITNSGSIVGTQTIESLPVIGEIFIPFNVDIPYQVNSPTPVRLTIRQLDSRTPGDVYVYSQEIFLNP